MSEYIDIKAAIKRFNELHGETNTLLNCYNADWIISFFETLSTVNVAEVVRCKDCNYFLDKQKENHQGICMCGEKDTSYAADFYPYADDFCSYGERKDEK